MRTTTKALAVQAGEVDFRRIFAAFLGLAATALAAGNVRAIEHNKEPARGESASQNVRMVPYTDVGQHVIITGRFGEPLGQYLALEGRRIGTATHASMLGQPDFKVEKVNGKPLKVPVTLWEDAVASLPEGTGVVLEGYETGEWVGVPDEVSRRTGTPPTQAVFSFRVKLQVVRKKVIVLHPGGQKRSPGSTQ